MSTSRLERLTLERLFCKRLVAVVVKLVKRIQARRLVAVEEELVAVALLGLAVLVVLGETQLFKVLLPVIL
jgi:hypothetical protein